MTSPAQKQVYLAQVDSIRHTSSSKAKAIAIVERYRWLTSALVASGDTLLLVVGMCCIEFATNNISLKETGLLLLVNTLSALVLSSKTRYFDFRQGRHSLGKASVIALSLWFTTLFTIALSHTLTFQTALIAMIVFAVIAVTSGIIHHRFHWQGYHSAATDPYYQIEFAIKRSIDTLVAGTGLLMVSPLLVATTIALCLESKGSPLFKQIRVGQSEKRFPMFKFRSMRLESNYQPERQQGVLFKNEDDPRITQVGRIIRKFSIDEVPQLLNVIRGEMSLIGPRPVLESEYESMNWYHKRKFEVIPGMTGLWQITGRIQNKRDFLSVANYDVAYIENWCLAEDLRILIKTIPVVLFQRGAC